MNLSFSPPVVVDTVLHARLPDRLNTPRRSEWADANRAGRPIGSFIEGPCFDRHGHLHVCDIPFGRIFRVDGGDRWQPVADYDGWPNGMKSLGDGTLLVTDYRNGLVSVDPAGGRVTPVLSRRMSESFKGLNDLCLAPDGDVYFTDQGQTGLHDPTGRVYRWRRGAGGGRLDRLLDNVPSPNGVVLDAAAQVLFVAATRANAVWRMPLAADGGVAKVGLFCQLFGTGGPDGLALDAAGRLYVAHVSLGHVFVHSPAGELTHAIRSCAGQAVTNLAFDPGDPRTVFITESDTGSVLRARLPF